MTAFTGGISGLGVPVSGPGSAAPVVIEFAEAGTDVLKAGEIISGRVEAGDGAYRFRFEHGSASFLQPLRGGGIVPGAAAFAVIGTHANGFFLRPLSAGDAAVGGAGAARQDGPAAGRAPPMVGVASPHNTRHELPTAPVPSAAAAVAHTVRQSGEAKRASTDVLAWTKNGAQVQRRAAAGLAAVGTNLQQPVARGDTGMPVEALRSGEALAYGALKNRVGIGFSVPGAGPLPAIANSATTDKVMSGIDLQSLVPRAGPVATDFSAVRVEVPQAKDLDLKGGEVVQGVVERDGEGLRFSFDLSGQSVSIPLQGRELPTGKTVLTLSAAEPGQGWLRPGSIAPAPVDAGAPQYINESMTAASLLLRPQNAEALAGFLAPANLSRLLAHPEFAEHLVPLLKNRLKSDRFGPAEVKSAFESCGIWAEGLLAQGRPLRKNDVKSALLGILNANREGLAEMAMLDQFSAALGSIESAQVQAAQAQIKGELLFNFFIPFADANPVKVSVSRAAPSELQSAPPLVVNLYTKNDSLGEVWLNTQIEKNTDIEIVMWAVESKVVSAASAASRRLLEHFREFGLQLKKISIINGARPEAEALSAAAGQLVNIQI